MGTSGRIGEPRSAYTRKRSAHFRHDPVVYRRVHKRTVARKARRPGPPILPHTEILVQPVQRILLPAKGLFEFRNLGEVGRIS